MRVLGIDVGGSGIKGALVDIQSGKLVTSRIRHATPKPATPKAVAHTIAEISSDLKWKGRIGVGFPAVIQNGIAKTASNVDKSWIGTNAVKLISKATGATTTVLNDADAAALAELHYGRKNLAKGTVLFLTIGTGIGTVILSNGQLVPNAELGHLVLKKYGDSERYCSDAARKRCRLTWQEWTLRFNNYLEYLEFLFHPDLFVLGGGASKKPEKFVQHLSVNTPIKMASLKNEAGIIGAAWAVSKIRRKKS